MYLDENASYIYKMNEIDYNHFPNILRKVLISLWACCAIHFMFLINIIKNADCWQYSSTYLAYKWEVSAGRWLIPLVDLSRGRLNIPYFSAMSSFVVLSVISCIFVKCFPNIDLLDKCIMLGLFFSAPFVCNILSYSYCAEAYFISFLFSILSSLYIVKMNQTNKVKYGLISAVSLVCSMALYQAFFPVVLEIVIFCVVNRILNNQGDGLVVYNIAPIFLGGCYIALQIRLF